MEEFTFQAAAQILAFRADVYIHPCCDSSEQLEPCWIINGGHQRPVNVGVHSPECLCFYILAIMASSEDKLISLLVIWCEEGGGYLPSSKAIINPMYYLHASSCPLSLLILLYSPAALSFLPGHVSLPPDECCSLVPFTHHHLL